MEYEFRSVRQSTRTRIRETRLEARVNIVEISLVESLKEKERQGSFEQGGGMRASKGGGELKFNDVGDGKHRRRGRK